MGTLQSITVAGLVADLGLTGYSGLTVAVHTSDHTKLDITVTRPAWALLSDGTLLTTELVSTTIQAPTANATYHLYVDAVAQVTATVPAWTIAATAPSATALLVADVTVSSNVISTATGRTTGLRNIPLADVPAPAGVPVLHGPYVVNYTDIPHDGNVKTLWTPEAGDVLLRLFWDWHSLTEWDHGNLFVGQGVDGTVVPPHNTISFTVGGYMTSVDNLLSESAYDASGNSFTATGHFLVGGTPVQIQLAQTSGTDPTQGHVELYALVARAVAP